MLYSLMESVRALIGVDLDNDKDPSSVHESPAPEKPSKEAIKIELSTKIHMIMSGGNVERIHHLKPGNRLKRNLIS